uniref:Uncharacterized protein n=1 Tax=Arundo donax TaxID=35708 RepID=A0A0A9G1E9_ARUDO
MTAWSRTFSNFNGCSITNFIGCCNTNG